MTHVRGFDLSIMARRTSSSLSSRSCSSSRRGWPFFSSKSRSLRRSYSFAICALALSISFSLGLVRLAVEGGWYQAQQVRTKGGGLLLRAPSWRNLPYLRCCLTIIQDIVSWKEMRVEGIEAPDPSALQQALECSGCEGGTVMSVECLLEKKLRHALAEAKAAL